MKLYHGVAYLSLSILLKSINIFHLHGRSGIEIEGPYLIAILIWDAIPIILLKFSGNFSL